MKQFAKRGLALLLALVLCIGMLPGARITAQAATVNYQTGNPLQDAKVSNVIKNWGTRGTTATFLSPNAEAFYEENNTTYSSLAQLSGSASVSSVPQSALYKTLKDLMSSNHSHITTYNETRGLYAYTDCQNNNINTMSCFYSGKVIGPEWDSGKTWNREHTWPNSKGDASGQGENDIIMLRPTSSSINSSRGNTAYGESGGFYDPNEPSNGKYNLHGDVARILLFVYVRWGNTSKMWGESGVIESRDVLLKWMEEDPVDTWELGRNDSVESITGTRNVFVDYPELAFVMFGAEVPANMATPSNGAGNTTPSTPTTPTEPTPTEPAPTTPAGGENPAGLTTGKYILTASNGEILGHFDGGWVVTGESDSAWTVTITNGTVTLQDANGTYIAPKGGNNNGIKEGEYSWKLVDNKDGTYSIHGQGEDTVILAFNTDEQYLKFRAYKSSTVEKYPDSYPNAFTLTPVTGGAPETPTEPKPTEPTPTEPQPTEPTPTEPQSTEPENPSGSNGEKYILTASNGEILGHFDGGWVVTGEADSAWTVTITNGTVTLQDANGTYIAPKGGNNNGIKEGEYSWKLVDNKDGTYSFHGQGEDTVILAFNTDEQYLKFRAYKSSTVEKYPDSYPNAFTLTPVTGGEPEDPTEPTPTEPGQPSEVGPNSSAAEVLAAAAALEKGGSLDFTYTLTGVIQTSYGYNETYRNITVIMATGDTTVQCYRLTGTGVDQIEEGDTITVTGVLGKNNSGYIRFNEGCTLVSYEKGESTPTEPGTVPGTLAEQIAEANKLANKEYLSYESTITGTITNDPKASSRTEGSYDFTVTDGTNTIRCYYVPVTGGTPVKGDKVTVTGKLTAYNGAAQFDETAKAVLDKSGTADPEPTDPTPTEPGTVPGTLAEQIAAANGLGKGEYLDYESTITGTITDDPQLSKYNADSYKFTVTDGTNTLLCYYVPVTGGTPVKGDKVTVTGKLTAYNGKAQFDETAKATLGATEPEPTEPKPQCKPGKHTYDDIVDGTCNVCGVKRENVEIRQVVHMFRMYNPNTGEHFYTGSTVERDNLIEVGWRYEGVGFTFPANTGAPVYRLFHEPTGEHLYTMDKAEKEKLEAEGWNYEGVAFNSAYNTEAVQHRLHNPNATVGAYHFTFSEEEKQNLIDEGWEYQGIGWYSCFK